MDTIKKTIWGDSNTETNQDESGREPVSGETGNTGAGEPYDAGNSGNHKGAKRTTTDSDVGTGTSGTGDSGTGDSATGDSGTGTSGTGTTGSGAPGTGAPGNTGTTGPIRPEHDTEKTGVTSANKPATAFGSEKPTSSNDNSGSGAAPSVGAHPSSGGQQEKVEQQGAGAPEDEPEDHENKAIKETKKEAEEASKVNTDGPGPKPLSETQKGATGSSGGDGDDDGPQKESHGEGTGEKYVKSSGMKADGGDFDAAAAGAGKEADRLLEQKGVHHTAPGENPTPGTGPDAESSDTSSKPSMGDKLKAKIGKH